MMVRFYLNSLTIILKIPILLRPKVAIFIANEATVLHKKPSITLTVLERN